jgi:prevent-host-death family protein
MELEHMPSGTIRDEFTETVNKVAYQGRRIIIDRHRKPVAAIVPMSDLELLLNLKGEEDKKRTVK